MPPHVIEPLHVSRGVHFPELRLDFSPHLNCIIAPRGAGKTTALHLSRFALDAPAPAEAEARVRYDAQVRGTLGGSVKTKQIRGNTKDERLGWWVVRLGEWEIGLSEYGVRLIGWEVLLMEWEEVLGW